MKKQYLILIVVLIFFISTAVRYYPIFHKGYVSSIAADSLILARNLSLNNGYKLESGKNIILNSSLVKDKGIASDMGNKLTPILYSKLFNIFGFNTNIPLYTSLMLYALTTVFLLFLIVLKLFNWKIALIFAVIDIFSPLVLANVFFLGSYEWAVFLFVVALFVYFYKEEAGYLRLFLSGLFFGLASLAGNIFLISFLPFVFYEFYKNKSFKKLIIIVLPVVLLWAMYLGPGLIKEGKIANNPYLSPKSASSASYLHLFPDPYTYHFEKDAYLKTISNTFHPDWINALMKRGYGVKWSQRTLLYFSSATFYVKEFFRLTNIGGALTILLLFLGIGYLVIKKNKLVFLFACWIIVWYLALVGYGTSSSHHFLELRFPIILSISLGIYWALDFIFKFSIGKKFKNILVFALFLFILLDLNQSDKWLFHEQYENSNLGKILKIVEILKKADINKENDIIAVGTASANNAPLIINYYTDLSLVYFGPETIKTLLEQNKLKEAFDYFGVTGVTGYDSDLTRQIYQKTTIKVF